MPKSVPLFAVVIHLFVLSGCANARRNPMSPKLRRIAYLHEDIAEYEHHIAELTPEMHVGPGGDPFQEERLQAKYEGLKAQRAFWLKWQKHRDHRITTATISSEGAPSDER